MNGYLLRTFMVKKNTYAKIIGYYLHTFFTFLLKMKQMFTPFKQRLCSPFEEGKKIYKTCVQKIDSDNMF